MVSVAQLEEKRTQDNIGEQIEGLTKERKEVQEQLTIALGQLRRFFQRASDIKYDQPDTSLLGVRADSEMDKLEAFLRKQGVLSVTVKTGEGAAQEVWELDLRG